MDGDWCSLDDVCVCVRVCAGCELLVSGYGIRLELGLMVGIEEPLGMPELGEFEG